MGSKTANRKEKRRKRQFKININYIKHPFDGLMTDLGLSHTRPQKQRTDNSADSSHDSIDNNTPFVFTFHNSIDN